MFAEVRTAGLLVVAAAATLVLAFQFPGEVFVDFGPNDSRYVRGFREDFEIDGATLIHWTTSRAEVELPFRLVGPYQVTLRYKRHIERAAEVRLFLDGDLVETFQAPTGNFALRTVRAENPERARFELLLLSRSQDPRPLGIALDWMLVRPAARFGALLPTTRALLALLSWVLAFYLVPRLTGVSRVNSLGFGVTATLALAIAVATNKMWPVHAALTLGVRAHVVALLLVVFFRWRRNATRSFFNQSLARWAIVVVYVGFAVRLFALFHPDFYYPDVRTHSKFVSILWTEGLGGFFSNYIGNQHRHLLGLQLVEGRWLAFPYPPLLYLSIYPLSLIELPVEDWMKLVPTALVAVEALGVFALAGKLGASPRAALVATGLHATARVVAFRLAVASYAALFGHFWDVMTVLYLVVFFERIERPWFASGFAALCAMSLLSYAGSALVLGLFVPAFCLAWAWFRPSDRSLKTPVAIAAWAVAAALSAAVSFYWQYVPELLTPDAVGPATPEVAVTGLVDPRLTPLAALSVAVYRLNLFFHPVFVLAALSAVVWRRYRRPIPLASALVAATLVTYLGLNVLRGGLGDTHIFQFSKDDLVVLPLIAIALGLVVDALWSRASGRVAAILLIAGWAGWGGYSLANDVRTRFLRPDYPPPSALQSDSRS